MSNDSDAKALHILEQAIDKAQESLEKTKYFQPFIMLLNDAGKIEIFENKIEDSLESYELLEEKLKMRMKKGDVDVLALVVDTTIPERFDKGISNTIRVHLEEKSQVNKKVSARFLYVPYELCKSKDTEIFIRLHQPIPVGFPSEYIVKQ